MLHILLCVLGVIVLCLLFLFVFPVIQVIGFSMFPTYKNGEIMLGFRFFPRRLIKEGDVVVFRHEYATEEEDPKRPVIKRVSRVRKVGRKRYFYFLGDNPDESYDSRDYGYVPSSCVLCWVLSQRPLKF